jgi:hypothetical protein
MLNLEEFESFTDSQENGLTVDIVNPVSGESTGAKIVVAGPDSRIARKARHRVASDMLSEGSITADRWEITKRMIALCTISWEGIRWGGEDLECNVENVMKVLERFPWIEAQIDAKATNRVNFVTS